MTHPDPNVAALRRLMAKHNLKTREIAEIADVHIHTVESWLANPESTSYRKMAPRYVTSIAALISLALMQRATVKKEEMEEAKKKRKTA